jgi:hypothetical protein
VIFVITIVLKLITAIYRSDKPFKDWKIIVKEYVLKGMFFLDVASTLPLCFAANDPRSKNMYFLKLIRLLHFSTWRNLSAEFMGNSMEKFGCSKQQIRKAIFMS